MQAEWGRARRRMIVYAGNEIGKYTNVGNFLPLFCLRSWMSFFGCLGWMLFLSYLLFPFHHSYVISFL